MWEFILPLLAVILYFALTVGLTILIETPIIVRGRVTDNRAYIRGVNIVTNAALNLILFGIQYLGAGIAGSRLTEMLSLVWFILGETILVPVSEALAYRRISDAGTKRIFAFTYLANLASCAAGLVLGALIWYLFY